MRTRCRNFDSDGRRRSSCRPDCPFVHPNNPDWDRAPEYRFDGGGRGRGRGRGRGGYHDGPSDRTRRPSNSSSVSNDTTTWDPSSWGAPPAAPVTLTASSQPLPASSPSNRDSSGDTNKTPWATSSSVGWGGSGWGSSGAAAAWDNAESTKVSDSAAGGGWGTGWSTSSPVDKEKDASGSNSKTNTKEPVSSGWGSSSNDPWGLNDSSSASKTVDNSKASRWHSSSSTDKTMVGDGWGSETSTTKAETLAIPSGWGPSPSTPTTPSLGWNAANNKPPPWDPPPSSPAIHSRSSFTHNNDPKSPLSSDGPRNLPISNSHPSDSGDKAGLDGRRGGWSTHVDAGDMPVDQQAGPSTTFTPNSFDKRTKANTSFITSTPTSPASTAGYQLPPSPARASRVQTHVSDSSLQEIKDDKDVAFLYCTPYTPLPTTPGSAMAMTRSQVFIRYISDLLQAIWYKQEIQQLEVEYKAWAVSQRASGYAKASPKVAQILDQQRSAIKEQLTAKQKRFEKWKASLASLPSLDDPRFLPEFDVREVEAYIARVKTWIDEAKLYQQLTAPAPSPQLPPPGPTSEHVEHDIPTPLAEMQETIERLEEIRARIDDAIAFRRYTNILDKPITEQPDLVPRLAGIDDTFTRKYAALEIQQRTTGVSTALDKQAILVADLLDKGATLDTEILKIRTELDRRHLIRTRAEESLRQLEEGQKEDARKIQALETKLQQLRDIPRPPPPPVDVNALIPILRAIFIDQHGPEVQSYLDTIREEAQNWHQRGTNHINNRVQQAVDMTSNLQARAREAANFANITNVTHAAH